MSCDLYRVTLFGLMLASVACVGSCMSPLSQLCDTAASTPLGLSLLIRRISRTKDAFTRHNACKTSRSLLRQLLEESFDGNHKKKDIPSQQWRALILNSDIAAPKLTELLLIGCINISDGHLRIASRAVDLSLTCYSIVLEHLWRPECKR